MDALLHCEGEVWAVHWGGRVARVRDSRGMRHLATLLSRPGTEVHSLELGGAPGAVTSGDAAPLLDDRARAAYKQRLTDLAEELDEAETFNDGERAARIQAEIDALVDQLTAAAGLGGRDRGTTTDAERARVAVRRAVKSALDRLRDVLPELGAHLDATVRTGVFCAYVPDPASPVRWQVLDGAAPAPSATAPASPVARTRPTVVGRDAERAALRAAWAAGRAVVLLSGEPGIGKTTLLDDLAADVPLAVSGRCDEHVAAPFQPLVEIVRGLVAADGADAVRTDAGVGVDALARVVPELGGASAEPGDTERLLLFDAVAAVIAGAARRRPLLVTVDDVHWAPLPTLAMLLHVVRQAPCVVVLAHRDTEGDGLAPFLADVARLDGVHRVQLRGLDENAAVALGASERDAARLVEHTGGNPFFLRALLEAPDGDALPASVLDVVAGRVQRLPDAAQRLVTLAAVAGERVDARVLATLATDLDAVDLLLDGGLLVEDGDTITFPHALVRRAVLDRTSGVRRRALHAEVARAVEAAGGSAGELAFHWAEAGEPQRAIRWCIAAADAALRSYAFEEAIDHAERGLSLGRDGALLLRLGQARHASGDVAASRAALEEAIALAEETGDGALLADATVELGDRGAQVGVHDPVYAALLRRAADVDDDARRATVLARLAIEEAGGGRGEAARAHADEALALARRSGDHAALLRAITAAHHVHDGPHELDRRVALATELAAGARSLESQLVATAALLTAHVERGDIAAVDASLARLTELVDRTGMPRWAWYLAEQQALRALIAGDVDAADAAAHRALDLGLAASVPNALRGYSVQLFAIREEQGRSGELTDVAVAAAAEDPPFTIVAALACVRSGRTDEARDLLSRADLAALPLDAVHLGIACVAAELAMELGDVPTARTAYDLLAPHANRVCSIALGTIAIGPVDRYLSYAARTVGDIDRARTHLTAAIALDERLGAARWLDRDRTDLSRETTWASSRKRSSTV